MNGNETLIAQLHNPDPAIRSQAVLSLGRAGESSAVPALMDLIAAEPDLNVREDITWSLVNLAQDALAPLIQLLSHGESGARHQAAHVLGKLRDARAVDALMLALADADPTVCRKAAFSLGQIGDARALPALVARLGGDDLETRSVIVAALESFGKPAVAPLIRALADARWQVREQAADVLGLVGDRTTVPMLADALSDLNPDVRFAVASALSAIGGPTAQAALASAQNDSDPRVAMLARKVSIPRR